MRGFYLNEIIRNMDERKTLRRIYRKHCCTNHIIFYNSNSSLNINLLLTDYRFYIVDAFAIFNENYVQNEINKITHIAIDNRFSPQHLNKLIYKIKQQNQTVNINKKELKICTYYYVPGLYERLRYALQKFDFNLTAKPPIKLKD